MVQQAALFESPAKHDTGCKRKMYVPRNVMVDAWLEGCYRYILSHRWGLGKLVAFAMMNPSDADDGLLTDATIAKCDRLAKRWGYDGTLICNACAYRATQQKDLLKVIDPVGPNNEVAWRMVAEDAGKVIVAHGKLPGKLQVHANRMVEVFRRITPQLYVLKLLLDGTPGHPLGRGRGHIPEDVEPVLWEPAA